jgi:arylsulfatase A-like enzyme
LNDSINKNIFLLKHQVLQPEQPTGLPTEFQLMPDIFKKFGYATHLVGK